MYIMKQEDGYYIFLYLYVGYSLSWRLICGFTIFPSGSNITRLWPSVPMTSPEISIKGNVGFFRTSPYQDAIPVSGFKVV